MSRAAASAVRATRWGIADPDNLFRTYPSDAATRPHDATLVLSVRQPHAQALLEGRKAVEWRGWWPTAPGWLWLHASSAAPESLWLRRYGWGEVKPKAFHGARSALIGLIHVDRIVTVKQAAKAKWAAPADREWAREQVADDMDMITSGWRITEVRSLTAPVRMDGKLYLWPLAPSVRERALRLVAD